MVRHARHCVCETTPYTVLSHAWYPKGERGTRCSARVGELGDNVRHCVDHQDACLHLAASLHLSLPWPHALVVAYQSTCLLHNLTRRPMDVYTSPQQRLSPYALWIRARAHSHT